MKFEVSSTKLFSQLQAVSRVIATKNTVAILDCVLFELEGNALTLTASDSETTIRTTIDVENAEGAAKVAFGAKLMLETLKEFPEQPLTFSINDSTFGLEIKSANGVYSFVGQNGNDYPQMPMHTDDAQTFIIPAQVLSGAIAKTIYCTSDDEYHPVMNGIFFDLDPEKITMVATDSHRMVRYANQSVHADQKSSFVLPKKPANLLRQVLAKEQEEVMVSYGEKNVLFEFGRTVLNCRQIEGKYPNYAAAIPKNNDNKAIIDRLTLLNACRRVAVFANTGTALLKLSLSENQLNISAQDIDFSTSADETIVCNYSAAPMSIGFKAPFLIEILGAINSQEVMLELSLPSRPGLIVPMENEDNEDLLLLLMPILLND